MEPVSIAIWNKNKVVIVLSTSIWGTFLAFLIEGSYHSFLPRTKRETLTNGSVSGVSRVNDHSQILFCSAVLNYSQLHSEWQPGIEICTPPNMESNKLTIIAMFTADTVLALIMLIGLLRLRGHGGGMFNLGRLLWKQVSAGGDTGPLWCSRSPNAFSVREGVIWLLIATAAGLITVASTASFLVILRSQTFYTVGICVFRPEPYDHLQFTLERC